MRSINLAFNPFALSLSHNDKNAIDDVQVDETTQVFDSIVRILQTAIPIVEIDKRPNQRKMRIRVHVSHLFQKDAIVIKPTHKNVFMGLADVLASDFLERRLTAEITMGLNNQSDFLHYSDSNEDSFQNEAEI